MNEPEPFVAFPGSAPLKEIYDEVPADLCDFVPTPAMRGELPPVRLDPTLWAPPLLPAKPRRRDVDPLYDEYRAANRPFRRAFPGGELRRKTLLAVGQFNAQRKEA